MNTKTMEGLVGARSNINAMQVPMRVYREAERRGDKGAMERAMGYAGDFADKAKTYKEEAYDGMKEEAKENREKEKARQEKMLEKRRQANKEAQKKAAEQREQRKAAERDEQLGKADQKEQTGTPAQKGQPETAGTKQPQTGSGGTEMSADVPSALPAFGETSPTGNKSGGSFGSHVDVMI